MTAGYAASEKFLLTENCYRVQFCVSVKLPNVGGLCSVVLITGALKVDFLHTKNGADFPPSPQFLETSWVLAVNEEEISNTNFFLVIDIFGLKKCCHSVSSPG